jgi:hypothetical protein
MAVPIFTQLIGQARRESKSGLEVPSGLVSRSRRGHGKPSRHFFIAPLALTRGRSDPN